MWFTLIQKYNRDSESYKTKKRIEETFIADDEHKTDLRISNDPESFTKHVKDGDVACDAQ